jgi:Cu+-exporting ATPase
MVATGVGARMGILIKGGAALETAHKVTAMMFDKTGTLTKGKPELTDVTLFTTAVDYEQLLFLAASAELSSEHVLARAVVAAAQANSKVESPLVQPEDFEGVSGRGLRCTVRGNAVSIGNRAWMADQGVAIPLEAEQALGAFESAGRIGLCVSLNGHFAAVLALADVVKPEAASTVRALTRMGVKVFMCSGDNRRTCHALAEQVGIPAERVLSECLPADKYNFVKKLQSEGEVVGMLGDGVNDAPSLAAADLGMSVGAGTDIAMEAAQVVLVKSDLRDVLVALDLSRVTLRRIRINFAWALGYNLIGVPVAAGLFFPAVQLRLPPELAAFAMALSSVSVICSSLALKSYRKPVIRREKPSTSRGRNSSASDIEIAAVDTEEIELTGTNYAVQSPRVLLHPSAGKNLVAASVAPLLASVASAPRQAEQLLQDDSSDSHSGSEDAHDDFCPCGCECTMRWRANQAAVARAQSTSPSVHEVRVHLGSAIPTSNGAERSNGASKSCCSTPPSLGVPVHLSSNVPQKGRQRALCRCSWSSCACTHDKSKHEKSS